MKLEIQAVLIGVETRAPDRYGPPLESSATFATTASGSGFEEMKVSITREEARRLCDEVMARRRWRITIEPIE